MHTYSSLSMLTLGLICLLNVQGHAQQFIRRQLPSPLQTPWEITYGPDSMLWITEEGGKVSRMDPVSGQKSLIYEAPDYFGGDQTETARCGRVIGAHTYGLALHPDFVDSPFVYFMYSYNQGTDNTPSTRFKIVKLSWDAANEVIIQAIDLIPNLPNGYDHWGGRMIATKEGVQTYLYFSIGDLGSTDESCYQSPSENPNLQTQDPTTLNGKIHRVYLDGTIPLDNPIPGNSFFTRGHRNPQGLAYNPVQGIVYDIEHGHRTDDEINVLHKGMNYGWRDVSGFHDGNYPEEIAYVADYQPDTTIPNDSLVEPLYAWGTTNQPNGGFLSWPTVAPSDGIYYGSETIPSWTNSLLVVTLKDGNQTDMEVFQFNLTPDGKSLIPSTLEQPNPRTYFGEDQQINGRLRDIAVSPDGSQIFLITNNWGVDDFVIVYSYIPDSTTTGIFSTPGAQFKPCYPNPFFQQTTISYTLSRPTHTQAYITDLQGKRVHSLYHGLQSSGMHTLTWNGENTQGMSLGNGVYMLHIYLAGQPAYTQRIMLGR